MIGALNWMATKTRPDIAAAIGILGRFMNKATSSHLTAAKEVLRYIAGTLDHALLFPNKRNKGLECYCDADWAEDRSDRKSTTGYIIFFGSAPIAWRSKKK